MKPSSQKDNAKLCPYDDKIHLAPVLLWAQAFDLALGKSILWPSKDLVKQG